MRNFLKRAKTLFYSSERKKKEFAMAAQAFCDEYKGSFVLLADPDTDVMFAAYQGIAVPVRMTQKDGSRMHIVKNALLYSKAEKSTDQFLLIVDSMLFNIAKEVDCKRKTGFSTKEIDFQEGESETTAAGVKSPLQLK